MRSRQPRPGLARRGLTLVEMLVSVALLVMMMTVLVTIFGAATGAVSGLQAFQQLDSDLRQLDITIRQDLIGVTAHMTPPLNPDNNLGYFEYGENAFADIQGEDTDDYIRFTTKAPEGQLFMGRAWTSISPSGASTTSPQPIFITSQYAEVIYFLRNGNLYRRVILIDPGRQTSVNTVWQGVMIAQNKTTQAPTFNPSMFGGTLSVSWQGVNDLSARPSPSPVTPFPIVLNTLGDLTNRENRAFYPRIATDFADNTGTVGGAPDGIPDDQNPDSSGAATGDGVPDYYPTLYSTLPSNLLWEPTTAPRVAGTETMAFPYVFPGAYSYPDNYNGAAGSGAGWIHSLDPNPGFTSALDQLMKLNHSPLQNGDSLPVPMSPQTWWGFPTWKETMSPNWTDPTVRIATNNGQADGLHPILATAVPPYGAPQAAKDFLPPMTGTYRVDAQFLNDGNGSTEFATTATPNLWAATWEDDLVLSGVRSFDVKAYDDSYPGYVDLGWGDDLRLYASSIRPSNPPLIGGNPVYGSTTPFVWNGVTYHSPSLTYPASDDPYSLADKTYAHEGRIPPLTSDYRLDAQYPAAGALFVQGVLPYPLFNTYTGNLGDNHTAVIRLRRVWDSWSTDYTQAPANGINPTTKLPVGPPSSPPIYPSYPPPYPAPLRGIQIQVRVTDPRGERVKVLTIRQDFSDKL